MRRVLLAAPRGYCAGVERAVDAVERALAKHGAPVYVRKQIVHNLHVVQRSRGQGRDLRRGGDRGARGRRGRPVGPRRGARGLRNSAERHLEVIDATCPLVTKVHVEARRFAADGRTIVLIGHAGHEEVEGTSGQAPERTILVQSPAGGRARSQIDRPRATSATSPRRRSRSTRRTRSCGSCRSGSPRSRARRATTSATPRRTARTP